MAKYTVVYTWTGLPSPGGCCPSTYTDVVHVEAANAQAAEDAVACDDDTYPNVHAIYAGHLTNLLDSLD